MSIRLLGSNGVALIGDVAGPADGVPVLLLHGGGQTRHSWGAAVELLAGEGFRAYCVDQRGHGDSDWAPDGDYSLSACASDVRHVVSALPRDGGAPVLVGASLGGLASLVAVGEEPRTTCRGLALVDVAPRIEHEGRARVLEFMGSNADGFSSVSEAADNVARYLPHRPRPQDTTGLSKNLRRRADGKYYWHWDPRFVESRNQEEVADPVRLERAVASLDVPILLIRGGISDVISREGAQSLLDVAPTAKVVDVPLAGHMVAGDRNDIFADHVLGFLKQTVA